MNDYRSDIVQGTWQNGLNSLLAGALSDAARSFKTLLAIRPDFFDALHLLAVTYYKADVAHQAVAPFRRAILANPSVAAYHSNFATALLELGQAAAALRATVTALILDPGDADTLVSHTASLRECDEAAGAAVYGLRAIARQPQSSYAHSVLGQALSQQSLYREGIPPLQAAIALDPTNPRAHFVLGQNRNALGMPGAEEDLIRALRLRPGQPRYLATLAATHKFTVDDEWLVELRRAEAEQERSGQAASESTGLAFALGKALTDLGQKDEGFSFLLKANALKRRQTDYDEAITLPMFEMTREIFSPALIREKSGAGDPSKVPIFIVGMPRSGTTLIEQILASHSKVHGAGELPFFAALVDSLKQQVNLPFPLTVPHATPELLDEIGRHYIDALRAAFGDQHHVTDKMPGNLPFAGLIHLALPNAKIIQMRRDLTDVCLSCFSINFANGLDYTYDLGELGRYAYSAKRFIDHWGKVLPEDRLLTVNYEDFIEDQEGQTRRLLQFCGLPWEDACLSFYKTERAVKTASLLQVRRPIYKTSVGRWKPAAEIIRPLSDSLEGKGAIPVPIGSFWFDIVAEDALRGGDIARARRLAKISTVAVADGAEAWHALGLCGHLTDDNQSAARCLARSVSISPGVGHVRNNYGTVLRELGDIRRALGEYKAALCLVPNYADALYNLGNVQRQFDDPRSAERSYRRALHLKPAASEIWNELGATLIELDRALEARDVCHMAARLSPEFASTHFHLACAFDLLGEIDAMRTSLRTALVCDPAFHQALIELSTERSEVGDKAAAAQLLRRALALKPNSAEAWYNLASMINFAERPSDLAEVERAADSVFARQPIKSKVMMHFALARAFGGLGDNRRMFEEIAAGNRLKRATYAYDVAADEDMMRRIAKSFTRDILSRSSSILQTSDLDPIFIVGMPRSGTSLVEQILAALPGTASGGELRTLPNAVLAADMTFGGYPEILSDEVRCAAHLASVSDAYRIATAGLAPPAARLLDKLPGNFLFAGLILAAFPNARIIHCRREPLDICWSCYSTNFARGHEYCRDLKELGRYYRAYEKLAHHWRSILPAERYREIRYETLVEEPEAETRALARFCGLDWTPSCLDFHRQGRRTRTASQHQVRQPIYRTAVGKWKKYESFLTPLIEQLEELDPGRR